jgi:hypothetical protein
MFAKVIQGNIYQTKRELKSVYYEYGNNNKLSDNTLRIQGKVPRNSIYSVELIPR